MTAQIDQYWQSNRLYFDIMLFEWHIGITSIWQNVYFFFEWIYLPHPFHCKKCPGKILWDVPNTTDAIWWEYQRKHLEWVSMCARNEFQIATKCQSKWAKIQSDAKYSVDFSMPLSSFQLARSIFRMDLTLDRISKSLGVNYLALTEVHEYCWRSPVSWNSQSFPKKLGKYCIINFKWVG